MTWDIILAVLSTILILGPFVLVIIGQRNSIYRERYNREFWERVSRETGAHIEQPADPTVALIDAIGRAIQGAIHGDGGGIQQHDLPEEDSRDSDFVDRTDTYDPWMELMKDPDATRMMGMSDIPVPSPQPDESDEMD